MAPGPRRPVGLQLVVRDLDDFEKWIADGVRDIEVYLAKWAAFEAEYGT